MYCGLIFATGFFCHKLKHVNFAFLINNLIVLYTCISWCQVESMKHMIWNYTHCAWKMITYFFSNWCFAHVLFNPKGFFLKIYLSFLYNRINLYLKYAQINRWKLYIYKTKRKFKHFKYIIYHRNYRNWGFLGKNLNVFQFNQ